MARHTLSELARIAGATLLGDGSYEVEGTSGLADAGPLQISFLGHPRYLREFNATAAGAVVVPPGLEPDPAGPHLLVHADPSAAFTRISGCFAAQRSRPAPGVHPTAQVHPEARLGAGVSIGAFCTVGRGAVLGDRVVLHPSAHVGVAVVLGADCEVHAHAVLYEGVTLGARCLIHAGAVLGADGFGFEPPQQPGGTWRKIPHSGTVELGDDVEIGANTTIDRGRFGATRIARGAKLDNLVHVAHNVVIGEGTMIAAQTGVAGSARVGAGVQIGGQVGIGGHMEIGAGARLAGNTGVIGNVPAHVDWMGYPGRPRRQVLRQWAEQLRLGRTGERLRTLEKRLAALEGRAQADHAEGAGAIEGVRP